MTCEIDRKERLWQR